MIYIRSQMGAFAFGAVVRPGHAGKPLGSNFVRSGRCRGAGGVMSPVGVRASFSEEDHTSEDDSVFFYDETSANEHLKDWRTFRARLVARERDAGDASGDARGDASGDADGFADGVRTDAALAGREEFRRVFRERHVREGAEQARSTATAGDGSVWSHTITHPERGCLLVAKRPDLGMFSYSVVLLTEHDDEIGSSGLVLNMATPLQVSNLGLEDHISESLGKLPLYIGGPVTRNLLHVLHGVDAVEGTIEIVPGVYAGGVERAADMVLRGELEANEFRLLAGYSGWEPYQLSEEIKHGAWHVISASSDVILGCIKGDFRGFSRGLDFSGFQSGVKDVYGLGGHDAGVDIRKLNCWKAILSETMFGEH